MDFRRTLGLASSCSKWYSRDQDHLNYSNDGKKLGIARSEKMLRDGDGVARQDLVALGLRGEKRAILLDKGK